MTGNTDPRVEAAEDALDLWRAEHQQARGMGRWIQFTADANHRSATESVLAAADAADRAAGIVRVRTDDEMVEELAGYLPHDLGFVNRPDRDCSCKHLRMATISAVLAALRGES